MTQLFSEAWMNRLKEQWNKTPSVYEPLQKADFCSRIGYGFKGEPGPRGMLLIVNGMVAYAGEPEGGELDWDLRATPEDWALWIGNGFGLTKLGPAVATNSLEFAKGNYRQMIKNPLLGVPFLQHFELMRKV